MSGPTQGELPTTWGAWLPASARVRVAVVVGLLLLAYREPIRHGLVLRWLNEGNWSHGWLIPVFSLYFLATRRDALYRAKIKPNYLGAVILLASLSLYFVSAWWWRMSYPQALSLVGSIFGLVLLLCGMQVMRVVWFPILFLTLAVPLPQRIYVELTQPLQSFQSTAAAAIMPLFAAGLHTESQAVVIDYLTEDGKSGQLNVEEACSGMRTMMAFVTLGVAMAYLTDRPGWQRLIMVLSCVPTAVFCNMVRVTATGLFFVYGHEDWAQGTPHQMLGVLMFMVALGLFSLIGYVLSHLFVEEGLEPTAGPTAAP